MTDRVVLITGATSGIGFAAAAGLAKLGATVLVHGRTEDSARAAAGEIRQSATAGRNLRLEPVAADLTSLAQVRRMAAGVLARHGPLHVLVNNAGVYSRGSTVTADGFAETWQVNVLAPFLLTSLLLKRLAGSAPSRIVNVSSMVHYRSQIEFGSVEYEGSGGRAYAESKLAVVLFSVELAGRLAGTGVTANAVHPGVVATKLLRTGWGMPVGSSSRRGGKAIVYLANAPELEGVSGAYFNETRRDEPAPEAGDVTLRLKLWESASRQAGAEWPAPAAGSAAAGSG